jgi:hypothetical protein
LPVVEGELMTAEEEEEQEEANSINLKNDEAASEEVEREISDRSSGSGSGSGLTSLSTGDMSDSSASRFGTARSRKKSGKRRGMFDGKDICFGNNVSFSERKTRRKFKRNVIRKSWTK